MKKWLGILSCGASFAQTATYPDRPITLIVTAAAGGVTDVAARAVGQELSTRPEASGHRREPRRRRPYSGRAKRRQSRPGRLHAHGGRGRQPPSTRPSARPILPHADRDFVPISGLVRINQALIGDNNLPAANAAEAESRSPSKSPGQLTYGTAGIGSAPHMNMARCSRAWRVSNCRRCILPARRPRQRSGRRQHQPDVGERQPGAAGVPARRVTLGIGSDRRIAQASDIRTVAENYPAIRRSPGSACSAPPKRRPTSSASSTRKWQIFADPDFRAHFLEPQICSRQCRSLLPISSPSEPNGAKVIQSKWQITLE